MAMINGFSGYVSAFFSYTKKICHIKSNAISIVNNFMASVKLKNKRRLDICCEKSKCFKVCCKCNNRICSFCFKKSKKLDRSFCRYDLIQSIDEQCHRLGVDKNSIITSIQIIMLVETHFLITFMVFELASANSLECNVLNIGTRTKFNNAAIHFLLSSI